MTAQSAFGSTFPSHASLDYRTSRESVLPYAYAQVLTIYSVSYLVQLTDVVLRWGPYADSQVQSLLLRAACNFLHKAAVARACRGPQYLR